MILQNKAPIDLEALTEYLACVDRWGFVADSEEQIALRHRWYTENTLGWFPEETEMNKYGDEIACRGKDWYRQLARAIIAGFAEVPGSGG